MRRVYFIVFFIFCVIIAPFITWQIKSSIPLEIAIIDKTVPNQSYREHQGLNFLLNQAKIVKEDGSTYELEEDYYGFFPNDHEETYENKENTNEYEGYDLIYLADTYGVYEEDLPYTDIEVGSSQTEKIYGGLSQSDWSALIKWLNNNENNLLIAEYNTFASPTEPAVMEQMADLLGVDWSGWTGRYFSELDPVKNPGIPNWVLEEAGDSWDYSGEGYLLVNDVAFDYIVLEQGIHMDDMNLNVSFTDEVQESVGISRQVPYQYWFDIITPQLGAETLATYEWELTGEGQSLLESKGIPSDFVAALKNESDFATSYYFAGDFNDIENVPSMYQVAGLSNIYRVLERFSSESFYWSIYFPLMQGILNDYNSKDTEASPVVREEKDELLYNARINEQSYELLIDNEWTDMTIKGVNMGMAKPGKWPGEAGITEEEYYRWFEMIGEMNANTIRVYTIHPPGFYQALLRYNETHEDKLYIMHGSWINEDMLVDSQDVFEPVNLADFQDEMETIIDVVHGNRLVEAEPGHASGLYTADISEYIIAWIIGIEWDPDVAYNTNLVNEGIGDYKGQYFETKGAQPFEHWLAMNLDHLVTYEMDNYDWIRPVSFSNWPTTDLLDHPSDLTIKEDQVSVDPNLIYTKGEADLTGQFASYHIYPYYPDFLNYDAKYQEFVDVRGEFNNYAGYLHELNEAHRLPILVAEFGIPASRGITHTSRYGWNQGFMSEIEQGEVISLMYEDMIAEGMLGGLVFTWQDEWFKRTWNTMDYDNPDRRPYWSNAQTNEQQFGVLSFDRHKIRVDGDTSEWESASLYGKNDGLLQAMYVDHDERYLYLRLDYKLQEGHYPVILLDVVPDQGNHSIKAFGDELSFSNGLEFIADLSERETRMLIDPYYDFYTYLYGEDLKMLDPLPPIPKNNSGEFIPIEYVLSREYESVDPDLNVDWTTFETGKLKEGNGNPDSEEYDSLSDYYITDDGVLEMRIPWLLIQAEDPTRKEFTGDLYQDGLEATKFVDGINLGVLLLDQDKKVIDSFPAIKNQNVPALKQYTWEDWDLPQTEERLKQSYYIIQNLFSK